MPLTDMSLRKSNMKLRIMGVCHTPQQKWNWSMVDLVTNTNKDKSLVMPRENRLRSLSLMCCV